MAKSLEDYEHHRPWCRLRKGGAACSCDLRHVEDMVIDHDGKPLAMAPQDVRAMLLKMIDEGDILAVVVRVGDDVGVQVFGPPSLALCDVLDQAAQGLRRATKGH